jgi:hypothetical protein
MPLGAVSGAGAVRRDAAPHMINDNSDRHADDSQWRTTGMRRQQARRAAPFVSPPPTPGRELSIVRFMST